MHTYAPHFVLVFWQQSSASVNYKTHTFRKHKIFTISVESRN